MFNFVKFRYFENDFLVNRKPNKNVIEKKFVFNLL